MRDDPGTRSFSPPRRGRFFVAYSFLFIFYLFSVSHPIYSRDFHAKAKWTRGMLAELHVDPSRIHARNGGRLKEKFLETLDPLGLFFLRSDIDHLESIPLDLDHWDADFRFFSQTRNLYQRRLSENLRWLEKRKRTPVDFAHPSLAFPPPRGSFPANQEELMRRWEAAFRFRMLLILYNRQAPQDTKESGSPGELSSGPDKTPVEMDAALEKELRELASQREERVLKEILFHNGGPSQSLEELYLNMILQLYDAHSSVFSAADRREFTEMLSTTSDSFGFVLRKRLFESLQVERVIPGGPAFRSGRIHKHDALLRIEFPDEKGRVVETGDLGPEEVNRIIYRSPSKRIIVTVRKRNGIVERVTLYRSHLSREENTVTGFVLQGDRRVGYIYIPSFYVDWDDPGAPAVANDVAKEILKLKKEKIEGLILDLRDNGGGSLKEALSLAGLFIDEGPLCILAGSDGKGHLLKDPARGSVYDGPLTVLVNGGSASASEIFAGAMQDYHRAVIVGSRTFGKASTQLLLPLVSSPSLLNMGVPSRIQADDYINLTTGRLYNLSGESHQRKGILPDVPLPEILESEIPREQDFLNPLEKGSIQKRVHYRPLPGLPLGKLARKSKDRVSDSKRFSRWVAAGKKIQSFLQEESPLPLVPDLFFHEMDLRVSDFRELEKVAKQPSHEFKARINQYDADLSMMDPYRKERIGQQIDQIQQDLYIEEACRVTEDLIDSLD